MRIAIIADIHGNLAALEAVLCNLDAEKPDQVICLGDIAATGPHPCETLERLQGLGYRVVLGNTDAYLLDPEPTQNADEDARRIAEIDRWCAGQLTPAHRAYIRTFQPTIELSLGNGHTLLCYHGSPRSYDDIITSTTPENDLAPMFAGRQATFMAGGHWHFQMLWRYATSTLLNPGSAGLAYDLQPQGGVSVPDRAEYALVTVSEAGGLGIEFRQVPYDREAAVQAMFTRGMPHAAWWASDWHQETFRIGSV